MNLKTVREGFTCWLYLVPALAFFVIFVLYSIFFAVQLSFFRWDGLSPNAIFVGIQNYVRLLGDEVFLRAIINTSLYTAGAIVFQASLGLLLALLISRISKGRLFFRTAYFVPVVMSSVIVGLLWSWFLAPHFGPIFKLFALLGLPDQIWLGNPDTALLTVLAVHVWKWSGWSMVIYLAGLQTIPLDLYEAARVEGATSLQIFWKITLPLLATATVINVASICIGSFQVFDLIFVMTQGGPGYSSEVMATFIYQKGFGALSMGYASAASCVLFLLILVASFFYVRKMITRDVG